MGMQLIDCRIFLPQGRSQADPCKDRNRDRPNIDPQLHRVEAPLTDDRCLGKPPREILNWWRENVAGVYYDHKL